MSRGRARDIAIVGMACRFPGAADLFGFWANVLANRDCTSDIPADRWPANRFFEPDSNENDRVACRRGGYLEAPIQFDAAANGIMPLAVEGGEPEQFLILETARKALDDASIDVAKIDRRRVEVVIGRGNYFNRGNLTRLQHGRIIDQTVQLLSSIHPEWTRADLDAIRHDLKSSLPPFEAATIPGQLTNATAGRVADRLDLSGASFVVDAASASSLVAVDLGCRALRERRADIALVGGVYLEADVDFPLVFRRLDALSRSGISRPFSKDADGMIPGEGVGVVVLKRLADAEAAGDRVYGVVKGVGLSSDGKGSGLAAPNARGHARAIRRAYRRANIDPASVMLLEGHGLGVPAADRAEIRALRASFPETGHGPRILGSVSSQIGHAMPAAGMAALIKASLSLHHRVLPPTRNSGNTHPLLNQARFELLDTPRPWIHADSASPRRAGVNAFGFAGINAHAVLEEHAASADGLTPGAMLGWDTEAILLADESREALADRVFALRASLERNTTVSLKDVAYTLNADSKNLAGAVRLGLVATSLAELSKCLGVIEAKLRDPRCRQIKDARGIYFWESPLGGDGRLAFLFPGEGSQYPGMLADLCPHFPEVRAVFDNADKIAFEAGETIAPSRHLFASPGSDGDALWSTDTAVTTVLSAQWALFQILSKLGLTPSAVAGHSSGELLALTAAGAIRMERTLERQLSRLSNIFHDLEASGAIPEARLVAFGADRQRVEAACKRSSEKVVVAIDNCPHQVVVAGPDEDVERVVENLLSQGVLCENLPFARAYHTSAFASVVGPLESFYASLEFHNPDLPIYSCASADRMPSETDEIRRLAVAQWTLPVAFRETIEAMHRDGLRVFVDVGARGNLCGYVEDILRSSPAFAVAANLPRRSGTTQLNHLVASLFAQGISLDASYLYARRRPVRIEFESPVQKPAATVALKVGFPEMKFSERLAADLRERNRAIANLVQPLERAGSTKQDHANGNGRSSGYANGHAEHPYHNGNGHFGYQNGKSQGLGLNGDHHANGSNGTGSHRFAALLEPDEIDETTAETSSEDQPMLAFLESMNEFLSIQKDVLGGFLGDEDERAFGLESFDNPPEPGFVQRTHTEPGPWVGEILEWTPGESIVSRLSLDPTDDPVAEHHTIGGRRISALDFSARGLPVVPFSVMAEMVAQVGALVVKPGLVLEALEKVHAHKWVQYGATQFLELRGDCLIDEPYKVHVTLHQVPTEPAGEGAESRRLVYEGIACFAEARPEPIDPDEFSLAEPENCVFTAERLYDEQWLFHGPAMQALADIGSISLEGVSGTIEVLPLAELLKPGQPVTFHTDPIVVDTFTHLLGCWGLDRFDQGDVIFPLGMGRLSIFGEDPPTGTRIECRIKVREIERHRILVDVELVRPDGRLWMTIDDWADWRFYWPGRYRDVFRAPDLVLLGEELASANDSDADVSIVWLDPPADMGRPVWREVLEQTQLSPAERAEARTKNESDLAKSHRIWGHVAAKEATRRLWLAEGEEPLYPADLTIEKDRNGFLRLVDLADPDRANIPSVAMAQSGGVAVAIAARDHESNVGIEIESIEDGLELIEQSALTGGERGLLSRLPSIDRFEWLARIWCAKGAAAKAIGLGDGDRVSLCEVVSIDARNGEMAVAPGGGVASARRELATIAMRVRTGRKNDYIWAWTLGEKVASR